MKLSTAIIGGILGVVTVAGLSIGLSSELTKKNIYDSRINGLINDLNIADQIQNSLNVTPPAGKGFIN